MATRKPTPTPAPVEEIEATDSAAGADTGPTEDPPPGGGRGPMADGSPAPDHDR